MSPDALNSILSLCIGFALAGALASGYQTLAQRPAGFGLLQEGAVPKTFAAVPFLVFAAPFIIMRNTLRGARIERRRFERRIAEGEIDAFLRSGVTLDFHPDGGGRHVEKCRADADRQPRRSACRIRHPGRPQQIGDKRDRAGGNHACQHDRNHVATGVLAGIAGEVLGSRKERHEPGIVRGSIESPSNMPCGNEFSHDFARSNSQATGCDRPAPSAALTFP